VAKQRMNGWMLYMTLGEGEAARDWLDNWLTTSQATEAVVETGNDSTPNGHFISVLTPAHPDGCVVMITLSYHLDASQEAINDLMATVQNAIYDGSVATAACDGNFGTTGD
jgi:hypothetical protein